MTATVLTYIVLLLLLTALIGWRYRTRRKNMRQYQNQREELDVNMHLLRQLVLENQRLQVEKDWLQEEVQHRVKDNLDTVISLLQMQARYLRDEHILNALHDISLRMQALALIHQRLIQEKGNLAVISMPQYVYQLVAFLEEQLGVKIPIFFELDIDPIELAMSQSIPVGLILNEAITNTIKYAFTENSTGRVQISMKEDALGMIILTVADNGRGLPSDLNLDNNPSMGLRLVRMLTQQLDGKLFLVNKDGLLLAVHFNKEGPGAP